MSRMSSKIRRLLLELANRIMYHYNMRLVMDPGNDYEDFLLNGVSCWISVGNASLYIREIGDRASVEVFVLGDEMSSPIDAMSFSTDLENSGNGENFYGENGPEFNSGLYSRHVSHGEGGVGHDSDGSA